MVEEKKIVLKNFINENLITLKDMALQFLDKISEVVFQCKKCGSVFLIIPEKIGTIYKNSVYKLTVDIGKIEIEKINCDEQDLLEDYECPNCSGELFEIIVSLDWYL